MIHSINQNQNMSNYTRSIDQPMDRVNLSAQNLPSTLRSMANSNPIMPITITDVCRILFSIVVQPIIDLFHSLTEKVKSFFSPEIYPSQNEILSTSQESHPVSTNIVRIETADSAQNPSVSTVQPTTVEEGEPTFIDEESSVELPEILRFRSRRDS